MLPYFVTLGAAVLFWCYPRKWLWHILWWASVMAIGWGSLSIVVVDKIAIGAHLDDVKVGKYEQWDGWGGTPWHSGLYYGTIALRESVNYIYCSAGMFAFLGYQAQSRRRPRLLENQPTDRQLVPSKPLRRTEG